MTHYYNEFDPVAARWLTALADAGHIPQGVVDACDIQCICPEEVAGFDQCHFFAGIGGWPLALHLAGWPEGRRVWTGSCPCQPFSVAGKGKAQKDERHLWPAWFRLIKKCRPDTIFGEQVAGAIGHGWLDGIQADLEGEGYAVGHCVLGAHSVGAPHIRQRLFWVAHAQRDGRRGDFAERGAQGGVADRRDCAGVGGLVHASGAGCGELCRTQSVPTQLPCLERAGHWSQFDLIPCADGKSRRIKPGLSPLVDGVPGRVGLLRGYGNAIVPSVAAEFIKAFLHTSPGALP